MYTFGYHIRPCPGSWNTVEMSEDPALCIMRTDVHRRVTRYGMRGKRVGEASNPGPRYFLRRRQTVVDVSSDSNGEGGESVIGVANTIEDPLTSLSHPNANRFTPLALSDDDEDPPVSRPFRRRRLVLRQSRHSVPETHTDTESEPSVRLGVPVVAMDAQDNSSDNVDNQVQPVVQSTPHVRRDVHKAAQVVRNLADRVGHVNGSQDVPRAIRRQQWSPFNVPLMWAAAAGDDTCPVLQWLASAAQHVESMFVAGSIVSGHDAAVVGWEALSEVMRSWDIRSREDLSEWIHRQGFPRPRWGAHITARAQERILTMAGAVDARVSGLEAVYVQVALLACMRVPMPVEPILHEAVRGTVGRQRTVFPETFPEDCWAVMDAVNLEDLFQLRFPVLQSCPHHVRGRFRQANRQVLEARHEAARSHDSVLEERAWKAFCILPMLLLRRPQGEGRVSKEELCRRCDLFAEGRWEILVDEAVACVTLPTPKREAPTDKQKAELACRKIRLGRSLELATV